MFNKIPQVLLALTLGILPLYAQAQTTSPEARSLVKEGVALYDDGQYEGAIAKYQEALKLSPGSPLAEAELALVLNSVGRNEEAIALCEKLIKDPKTDATVFITYGNSFDALKKPAEALRIYQEGLAKFPTASLLYFNQGITLSSIGKNAEASAALQQSARLNPKHPTSPLYLSLLNASAGNRIPAILEVARFLVLEPQGPRAAKQLPRLLALMGQGVTKQDDKNVTITLNSSTLKKSKREANKPDDFSSMDMLLSLIAANEYTEGQRNKTPVEKFSHSFASLCQGLAEQQGKHTGFVWEYYVPYFVAMEKAGHVSAFAYLAHASQKDDATVQQWLAQHPTQVQVFQEWSRTYAWPQ